MIVDSRSRHFSTSIRRRGFRVHRGLSFIVLFGLIASVLFLSCNTPFQPVEDYSPKLSVYSILFANDQAVYVKVTSVVRSSSDVAQPVHGASVTLAGQKQTISLVDTTAVINGVASSFYYAPVHVVSGGSYTISVNKEGYPAATADVNVPNSYVAIPDEDTYSVFQNPSTDISFNVPISSLTKAAFAQLFVEYRGVDSSGMFRVGIFNVFPVDSLDPFTQTDGNVLTVNVDTSHYRSAFKLAYQAATQLKQWHMYTDIIVTQIDDNLYRFFITSNRLADPLAMRTDKVIFTNIFNGAGTGIVAGAAVDTTRVFLF
jgi:hypothetical protein